MLVTTVAVAVFQSPDPSRGRCDRIIDHLGDIEPAVFVPRDRHGARDLGLGGHELDREGRIGQRKSGQLVARRARLRPGRLRAGGDAQRRQSTIRTLRSGRAIIVMIVHREREADVSPSCRSQSVTSASKPTSGNNPAMNIT